MCWCNSKTKCISVFVVYCMHVSVFLHIFIGIYICFPGIQNKESTTQEGIFTQCSLHPIIFCLCVCVFMHGVLFLRGKAWWTLFL